MNNTIKNSRIKINKNQIIEYYDSCEIDYKWFWHLDTCLAMHFGYWDNKVRGLRQALERENEILAEKVDIKKSDIVLDAGCGIGGSSIFLAKRFGCKVIGITLSQKQVSSAIKNAKKNGVERLVEFYKMDFLNTSFADNSFDVVWVIESICHADNKKRFIREAFRLLKKNGRLITADGFASKNNFNSHENKLMKKWLNGWGVNSLETSQNFEDYAKEVGFSKTLFWDITRNIMPSSRRLYLYSFPSLILGKIAEFLKIRTKVQTRNIASAHYQYKAIRKNLWKYGIFYAEK